MDAAHTARAEDEGADILAKLTISEIKKARDDAMASPLDWQHAFLLRSLKHPAEVTALRKCYGPSFILIGLHSEQKTRFRRLADAVKKSTDLPDKAIEEIVNYLIGRDTFEDPVGQQVRETFYRADIFIDTDADAGILRNTLRRVVGLLFSEPCVTPTQTEYGMALAHNAATRSASLARQVGAALVDEKGEVIALGCNELPAPGGGTVFVDTKWAKERDAESGVDTSYREVRLMVQQLLERLGVSISVATAMDKLKGSRVLQPIEFYREVHAEAAAVADAARRGVTIQGSTLYVTTFPCHDCAKLLLAAGIRSVVYLEPYPKSKTLEFFPEAFKMEGYEPPRVTLQPFMGIGPRSYRDLFSVLRSDGVEVDRKENGRKASWKKSFCWQPRSYLATEAQYAEKLKEFKERDVLVG